MMMKTLALLTLVCTTTGCVCVLPPRSSHAPAPYAKVTIKGTPVNIAGTPVNVGEVAPDFTALDTAFKPVSLSSFNGRPVLVSVVPSLDTPVCSLQTKRFNEELAKLPKDVAIITISMDLPMAQKRFCGKEGVTRLQVLSDSARREFGPRYGVWIPARGLLARSVFVIGRDGRVVYREVVSEVSQHPDYDAALKAVGDAAASAK